MIRAWTIQLAIEEQTPASSILAKWAELARSDPSPVVRLYLASGLQRLPLEQRRDILAGLVSHAEDAADHNLPLMYWYAAEPLAALDARRAARLASSARIARFREFMARRIGGLGTADSLALLVDELRRPASSAERLSLLTGIDEALRGRRRVAMPAAWPRVFAVLAADGDRQVRARAVALALTFGDAAARATLRSVLIDPRAEAEPRREALAALLKVHDPEARLDPARPGPRPAARRDGRARVVELRRSRHARALDRRLQIAGRRRAARRLEYAGGAKRRLTPCWPP